MATNAAIIANTMAIDRLPRVSDAVRRGALAGRSDQTEHRKDAKEDTVLRAAAESWIILLVFLLNFVWEMWQISFYEGMMTMPHWESVRFCTGQPSATRASP